MNARATPSTSKDSGDSPASDRGDADARIHALAAAQHGVVARWQLVAAGVPAHRIEYRLRRERICSIHRGVYGVGPVVAPRRREMAAVLRCGEGAAVSHRTAGAVWDLLLLQRPDAPVAVITPRDVRLRDAGIRVHRVDRLHPDETTRRDGLPITTPARTLLDLAGCLNSRDLERAVARADRRRLLDREDVRALLSRYPCRRGRGALRALIEGDTAPSLTRSEAESRLLELIRKGGLTPPETNVIVRGYEVDLLWRAERLVVEVDGFAFHSARDEFERDRHRDGTLLASGLRVMRVTWRQITRNPEALLVRLAQALAGSRGPHRERDAPGRRRG